MEITPQRGNQIVNGDSITFDAGYQSCGYKILRGLETFESIWTSSDIHPLGPKGYASIRHNSGAQYYIMAL